MKKQIIYWIIIGVLIVIILVQIRLNQSSSEPKLNNRNQSEIGRFQYFVDPNSNFGGFLDTKEGFAYVWVTDKWQAWDIKTRLQSDFKSDLEEWQTLLSDTLAPAPKREQKRKQLLEDLTKRVTSQLERIWK